ncbi:DUF2634 domain-containing protein [Clostridium hydrogenum]|uniref:DUF2634 domain-containing protein n=1 Tax=Clostridium hydrogenum TaxID=2855764 RepID=UPI001F359EF0|nr:DUF2634 domain-containing protein [Clostridium hydrogenum]
MIFPEINYENLSTTSELKPLKEYAWDFEQEDFILKDGKFQVVSGTEALKIWIWKALSTERYRYMAYSFDYGSEIEALIGSTYSSGLMNSEIERYLKEALLINPYIKNISDISTSIDESTINIACLVDTVYGEVKVNV